MRLDELARVCEATLEGDGAHEVIDVARPDNAGEQHVCFVTDKKYLLQLAKAQPGAVIAPPEMSLPEGVNVLRHPDPDRAFSRALGALRPAPAAPAPGVAPTAVVGEGVEQGEGVSIGHYAVIGNNVKLGANAVIHAHTYIGDDVIVGDDTVIYPHVTVLHACVIGRRCILHPGVVIGADGFGFHFVGGQFMKAPQRGRVEIGDDVEIGANSTIDRARFDVTRIGAGTKIDNMVQIAHNVQIGRGCVIAALSGIAGSSTLKDYVQLGGNAGVSDHITVGMGAKIAAKSGAMKDVPPGVAIAGLPAYEGREFMKREAAARKLPDIVDRVKALEAQIKKLSEGK